MRRFLTRLALWVGYLLLFVTFTVVFFVLGFPDEPVRQRAEVELSRLTGGRANIDSLSLAGLGGIEVEGVRIFLKPLKPKLLPGQAAPAEHEASAKGKKGEPKPKKKRPRIVELEHLTASAAVTPWIFGGVKTVDFEGEVLHGTLVDGRAEYNPDTSATTVRVGQLQGARLGPEQLVKGLVGYDLRGALAGSLEVTVGAKPEDLRGHLNLVLKDARIVKPTIPPTPQMPAPIELSDMALGDLQLKLEVDKLSNITALKRPRSRQRDLVVVHFADVSAESDDVALAVDDRSVIRLLPGKPMAQAVADLHLSVQVMDAYMNKKVRDADGHTSQPNKILRMALKQDRRVRAATRNGILGVYCRGRLAHIDCGLERPRRGSFKKRKPSFGTGAKPTKPDQPTNARDRLKDRKRVRPDARKPGTTSSRSRGRTMNRAPRPPRPTRAAPVRPSPAPARAAAMPLRAQPVRAEPIVAPPVDEPASDESEEASEGDEAGEPEEAGADEAGEPGEPGGAAAGEGEEPEEGETPE